LSVSALEPEEGSRVGISLARTDETDRLDDVQVSRFSAPLGFSTAFEWRIACFGEFSGIESQQFFPIDFAFIVTEFIGKLPRESVEHPSVRHVEFIVSFARLVPKRFDDLKIEILVARYKRPKILSAIFEIISFVGNPVLTVATPVDGDDIEFRVAGAQGSLCRFEIRDHF
jgi:hypothetical protein